MQIFKVNVSKRTCTSPRLRSHTLSSCPSRWLKFQKPKMLRLVPGRKREERSGETYCYNVRNRSMVGKVMMNTANTDGVILTFHWEMNHRLDFHLCPINQALPSVWRSCDWERRGRGLEEKSRKLRWDHLHYSSLTFTLQATPNSCTERLSHIQQLQHLVDDQICFIFYSFSLWTLGSVSPLHQHPCRSQPGPSQWTDT